MPPSGFEPSAEESLRAEAADWFARMRGPDAERDRAALERWLAIHPSHRQAYERLTLRWEQAGLVGHTPSGQRRSGLPAASVRPAMPFRYAALAASIVAAIVLGAFYLLSPAREGRAAAPVAVLASAELASPVGTIRRVTLDDGSVVTLDTGSRIEVAFTARERRLRLVSGRARFEVAHDASRPFVVAAGEGEVVATGTIFDVSMVGDRPRVRLIQGSVEVRRLAAVPGASTQLVARLAPGQAIALGVPDAKPSPAPAEDRWVSGMLSFDGVPLADALAEANRYSAHPIRLADPALGALRVSGGFKAGDQEAIADAIAASFDLTVEHAVDGSLILRRSRH
jgi:transmembrane sensor